MKRMWIVLLAVAVALAIAVPAGAKKPDKPPKPDSGFKPIACTVDEVFAAAFVERIGVNDDDELVRLDEELLGLPHIMSVLKPGVFWVTPYTVDPLFGGKVSSGDVLCLEVTLEEGTLSDLRVRWMDHFDNETGGSCGLFWARGKELRSINDGVGVFVFSTGLSLDGWDEDVGGFCGSPDDLDGDMTVAVMPVAKSDTAQVKVTIGIDRP